MSRARAWARVIIHARTPPSAPPASTAPTISATPAHPVAADDAQAAGRTDDRVSTVATVPGHAGVAQREVVLDGVGGVEGGQPRGDPLGPAPVPRGPPREAPGPA